MLLEIETDKVILEIPSIKKNFIIQEHQIIGSLKHINKVIKEKNINNFLSYLTFDTLSTYTRRIMSKKNIDLNSINTIKNSSISKLKNKKYN